MEAEKAVLGSLLIDRDTVIGIATKLTPDDFFDGRHRVIYQAILTLYNKRMPSDLITLQAELERADDRGIPYSEQAGGMSYVVELMTATPSAIHAEYYAELVRECAVRRRFIQAGQEILAKAWDESIPIDDVVSAGTAALHSAGERITDDEDFVSMKEVAQAVDDRLNREAANPVMIGVADVDYIIGGIEPGYLTIIAARTSVGKTALATNIAYHNGVKQGRPTGIISLEMTYQKLGERFVAIASGVNMHAVSTMIRHGKRQQIPQETWDAIELALGMVNEGRIFIDSKWDRRLDSVLARARAMYARTGFELLIVDYLQLMTSPAGKDHNRVAEVGRISSGLKMLARELNVPIIALAQLNRESEGRERPQLRDLRESGSIEMDADIVMLMSREGEQIPDKPETILVDVAKHRDGPTGEARVLLHPKSQRFTGIADERPH